MEYLKIIVALLDTIAWPGVALIIAILWRKDLTNLLGNLSKLKYGELEAEFRDVLESEESKSVASQTDKSLPAIEAIAEVSPNAAIPYAWTEFEKEVIDFISTRQGFKDENIGPRIAPNLEILREEGFMNAKDIELAHRLRRLRNEVSHHMTKEQITTRSAMEYAANIQYLIGVLQKAS